MIEHEVRDTLRRRAADVTVSPDAWQRISARITEDDQAPDVLKASPARHRFNRRAAMGAIAATLLIVVASMALLRDGDSTETLRATDEPSTSPSADREPATPPPAATAAHGQRPIWPATTDDGLARLQAEADAGRRPELLDPRAAAAAYLSDRFFDGSTRQLVQNFAVGEFAQGDPTSGEVPYQSPPDGSSGGAVLVRQRGGDGRIWFVVGSISRHMDMHMAAYDGSYVSGEVTVARPGSLSIRVSGPDGSDAVGPAALTATPDQPIALRQRLADKPAVVVQLRLVQARSATVSFAEFRVERFPTAAPPPVGSFRTTSEAAAQRWIRALAVGDGDLAWDLLAPASRAATGARPGFKAGLAELAEGWAVWDGAPHVSYRAVPLVGDSDGDDDEVLPADLPRLGVVIVSGRVSQEGTTTFRTMSLPVRGTKEKAQVDPFVGVNIELDPSDGASIAPRRTLTIYTVAAAKVWFILDDRAPVGPDNSEGADGDQQKATLTPPAQALSPGRHSFTTVVLTLDGRVASRSATYTVA